MTGWYLALSPKMIFKLNINVLFPFTLFLHINVNTLTFIHRQTVERSRNALIIKARLKRNFEFANKKREQMKNRFKSVSSTVNLCVMRKLLLPLNIGFNEPGPAPHNVSDKKLPT